MRLGVPTQSDAAAACAQSEALTLDDLFRAAVALHPGRLALVDPPDRARAMPGAPRRLTFREADRAVTGIASRLRDLGLPMDSVVAYQLPNTVESVVTLLGIVRAGLIPAPLPPLWRKADQVAALARIAPRALVTCAPADDAMHAAAETFSVRFVCVFGGNASDGLVPLDDVFTQSPSAFAAPRRDESPEDHVTLVTFDLVSDGLVPIARSHRQFIGAAQQLFAVAEAAAGERILTTLALSSFGALAAAVGRWLLGGGTLVLHHAFSPEVFAGQVASETCTVVIVPGPLAGPIAAAGLWEGAAPRLVRLWRSPERLFHGDTAPASGALDLAALGEIACLPVARDADGRAIPLSASPVEGDGRAPALAIGRTAAGTLACGGALVPAHPFPPGSEQGLQARLKISDTGWVDTEYPCRLDRPTRGLVVDAPPPGIISVGGCRFRLKDLQEIAERLDNGTRLAALPDSLSGYRLAGMGPARPSSRQTLVALGAHPLIVAAFRDRRAGADAA